MIYFGKLSAPPAKLSKQGKTMGGKLTKAQLQALAKADKPGGVVGFGQKYRVVGPLRKRGMLEPNRDNYGYMVITPAGHAALRNHEASE